jgi:RNA polymerase sigma-70 factor (ECF subfamily)
MSDRRRRFETQVLAHLNSAYRFARLLAPSTSDADDLVQEAILHAYRGFDSLRGTDAKAWLLTIVRNCHSTALRQEQRRVLLPLPDENDEQDGYALIDAGPDPGSVSIRRDEQRTLEKLIAKLPEDCREMLMLKDIEDLGYREIATVTDVPIGTVMSRLARARGALRKPGLQQTEGKSRAVP